MNFALLGKMGRASGSSVFLAHTALCIGLLSGPGLSAAPGLPAGPPQGLQFVCDVNSASALKSELLDYFKSLDIPLGLLVSSEHAGATQVSFSYVLQGPGVTGDTLGISKNPRFAVANEQVALPGKDGLLQFREVTSRKEIVLALLHPGRLTRMETASCSVSALKDHVGARQNIVAWASRLEWQWPEGEHAQWNEKYWNNGTPKPDVPLYVALNDVFLNQRAYSIGCYAATKLVVAQGVLDYYRRVKQDPVLTRQVEQRLLSDNEPLVDVEPGEMWSFEPDFDMDQLSLQGKLIELVRNVAPRNFVPGDWVYLLNTDPTTYQKRGYEGSNAIYLGQGKFDDYYNDNQHAYTYHQKLDEVYQWRHGVFSRSNDAEKIRPLSLEALDLLGRSPKSGGLVLSYRAIPRNLDNSP